MIPAMRPDSAKVAGGTLTACSINPGIQDGRFIVEEGYVTD
jgi:hypothetical protein